MAEPDSIPPPQGSSGGGSSGEGGSAAGIRRILVALDSSAARSTTLGIAAEIAAASACELSGLFVEDQDLLRLAELPFAREIQLARAMTRTLEPASLLHDLRAQAALARAAMEKQAVARRVAWSFRVAQGRSEEAILLAAGAGDIIAIARGFGPLAPFGRFGRQILLIAARAPVPLLLIGETLSLRPGPVLLPFDASKAAEAMLRLAADLALAQRESLEVMLLGEAAGTAETLAERIRTLAGGRAPELRTWLPRDRAAALRRLAEADRGLLALPASAPTFEAAQIETILERARVPILLKVGDDTPAGGS